MTSRQPQFSKFIFVGGQCLVLAGGAHAQEVAPVTPMLSPARVVASHITTGKTVIRSRSSRTLVLTAPATQAVQQPVVQVAALPEVVATQTVPGGAKSVITAPQQPKRRLTTPFTPAPSKPSAVPFVASPDSPPIYPTGIAVSEDKAVPKVDKKVALAAAVIKPAVTAPAAKPTLPAPVEAKSAQPRQMTPRVALRPGTPSARSREVSQAQADRLLLARLESDLNEASRRLDRARGRISAGQRQLAQFADVLQEAIIEAGPDAHGLSPFVKVAQRYRGTPYVWGGVSARGFDCSGFIIRVMQDLGYRALPHSAAEQFRYGIPVAEKLLKPGDLVFFANTYKPGISHVGIYLGRRRFIHAANSQVGTIVSSLNEPKWSEKYAGSRRLIPVSS